MVEGVRGTFLLQQLGLILIETVKVDNQLET